MLYAIEITCVALVEADSTEQAEHLALTQRDDWRDPVVSAELVENTADLPEHLRDAVVTNAGFDVRRVTDILETPC